MRAAGDQREVSERASGRWLIAGSILFWLSWTLMPGVGVTDTRQIFERVAMQRDAVWLSTLLQLVSAACFAPAVVGLARVGRVLARGGLTWGAVLLAIGAMGSAADAIFHLLAYYMTAPEMDLPAMIPLMERMQGPGLALLAPMLIAFFVGTATLAVACMRAGLVTWRTPLFFALGVAVAVSAPLLVRVHVPPRAVGLTVLALVSLALVGVGTGVAPRMRPARVGLGALATLVLLGVATFLAGERTEVVVLRTTDDAGKTIETKMWVVDRDGAPWVRVANAERGWYRRLVAHPRVELVRAGTTTARVAHPEPALRLAVDGDFAKKYGLTDWWYGALLRRGPVPIRLDPAP